MHLGFLADFGAPPFELAQKVRLITRSPGRPLDLSKGRRTPPDRLPAQSRSCAGNRWGQRTPSVIRYSAAATVCRSSLVLKSVRASSISLKACSTAVPIDRARCGGNGIPYLSVARALAVRRFPPVVYLPLNWNQSGND